MVGENVQQSLIEHILEQVGEIRMEISWIRVSHPLKCKGIGALYPQRTMSRGVVEERWNHGSNSRPLAIRLEDGSFLV